jgi:choline-glycine betaine transporter
MCNKEIDTTNNKPKSCIKELLKDKNGCYSLRELAIVILLLAVITSWLGKQFFNKDVPEFMFYSFASLIGAGCFGYSIEQKATIVKNT